MSLPAPSITRSILRGVLCLSLSCFAPWAKAGSPAPLSGGILGQVKSASSVAQMGATVLLYNRYDQLVRQALTNEQGKFAFDALAPDLYSIRVTLASFVPAIRRNIAVAAGAESLLQINLANLLSSVDLLPSSGSHGTLMSDEWKWVLRTSQATRPVLRFLPSIASSRSHAASAMFSDTTGLVRVSAGDADSFTTGNQQDLGTAFALATSLFGSARVQFSGNLGYAGNAGMPAAGFRTTYSRTTSGGSNPEVTLSVRQLYLPNRASTGMIASTNGVPVLRTASLAVRDKLELSDALHVEYGFSLESVSFVERLNYVSPFARATYNFGDKGSMRFAYSSGTQPTELVAHGGGAGPENTPALNQDLAALALLPRVSLRDGQAHVQRTESFELAYEFVEGSRTYSAGVYRDGVTNAALTMSAPNGFVSATDSLPDLGSRSRIFNVGNYQRVGYTAAVTQALGDHLNVSVAAGRTGALVADAREALSNDADDLRALIHRAQRSWVTARVSGTVPGSGTRISTSYGWTDYRALMPEHLYLAQQTSQVTGWNVNVRQPLPMIPGWPGRLEATAELRNLLAQGYLPLVADGRRALLTNSPRAVRGGLAFIF